MTRGGGPGVAESPAGGSVRGARGAGGAGLAPSCGTGIVPSGWGQICHCLGAEEDSWGGTRAPWAHAGRSGVAQLLSLSPSPSPGCSQQGGSAPHSQQGSSVVARWHWMCGSASPAVPELRFWQQLLSQACPVACQALSPAPALIRGARILQIRAVLERKGTRSRRSGHSLSNQEPHGRGGPALPGICCQLFPAPSGSPQHLQGSLAVESSAWSLSLLCWRWHRGCPALPGGLMAGGELSPGTKLLLMLGIDGTCTHTAKMSPLLPHPLIPCSPGGMGAAGWTPHFPVPGGR